MLVSHRKQFVYTKTRKTAGTFVLIDQFRAWLRDLDPAFDRDTYLTFPGPGIFV